MEIRHKVLRQTLRIKLSSLLSWSLVALLQLKRQLEEIARLQAAEVVEPSRARRKGAATIKNKPSASSRKRKLNNEEKRKVVAKGR